MISLIAFFSALTAFGLGVTIADLLGAFEHGDSGASHDGSGHIDDGHDSDGHDGADHDVAHDDAVHGGHQEAPAVSGQTTGDRGSLAVASDSSVIVARVIGTLRMGVYFSLGAGPTGLFGIFSRLSSPEVFAWSAGAGVLIAILVRFIRKAIRSDLDSTLTMADFVMDECVVSVGITAGGMGKVTVRRYGVEREFYARAKDPSMNLGKGQVARILDYDDSVCYVAPLS